MELLDCGFNGAIINKSGRKIDGMIYILMEYVDGGLFFNLSKSMHAMGEEKGRFFIHQLIDAVEYMN